MAIEQLFSEFKTRKDEYRLIAPDAWTQGRTLFGGISAALAYQAAENLIEDGRPVRSLHCNFVGPINANEEVQVSAEILRTGRNVTQILAKVTQNGQVATLAQVCFGVDRESKLTVLASDKHEMTIPKKGRFIPNLPKIVPNFIQHYDLSLDKGNLGLFKSDEAVLHGWSRYKQAPAEMTMAYMIAMMDAWPPTMLQMFRLPPPASTMSWDLEFINPDKLIRANEWLACHCEARHIENGYGHEEANFWDEAGNLLVLSRQVVAVFA